VAVGSDCAAYEYSGPPDPDALFADGRFVDCRSVKVGTSRLIRARLSGIGCL